MSTISVHSDFEKFCKALRMNDSTVDTIRTRYHSITKRINQDYWESTSDTLHSRYVGSYGRGTSIKTSDIDIIVELPWSEYDRFNNYTGNGQSALLSDLRSSLMKTYSASKISADGQVVDISFADGITFEVVPAFKYSNKSGYCYPDTNNGGSWKEMDPVCEILLFNGLNNNSNGNLKRLCRMLRAWKEKQYVLMNGILLDTTAYRFLQNYEYADKSYTYYDWIVRDYFKYLLDHAKDDSWEKPGNTGTVLRDHFIETDVSIAYEKTLKAIEAFSSNDVDSWHQNWRDIFGTRFPTA